jgi:hypothetical protein
MSKGIPDKTEVAVDYPNFHYAMLAEILGEPTITISPPEGGCEASSKNADDSLPPADSVGVAEKLALAFGQNDIAQLTPDDEVLLLHIME